MDCIFDNQVHWDENLLRGHIRTVLGNVLVKFEVRNLTLTAVEQLTFDAQKFRGHVTMATPPLSIKF